MSVWFSTFFKSLFRASLGLFGFLFFGFLGFFCCYLFPLALHLHCGTLRDGTSSLCAFTTSCSTPGTIQSKPLLQNRGIPNSTFRIPIHVDHTGLEPFTRKSHLLLALGSAPHPSPSLGMRNDPLTDAAKLHEEPGTLQATNLKMNGLVTQPQCWERSMYFIFISMF